MLSSHGYFGQVYLVRLLLQRGMAAMYLVAFVNVVCQFKPLLGERGLLPAPEYLSGLSWRQAPTVFLFGYSDRWLTIAGWTGVVLSVFGVVGLTEAGPVWVSLAAWLVLWVLYLSIVNIGQRFYGFGWESMLLEAGFFTAFLGSSRVEPSVIPVLILRWMLFRTELGAGLIKLRHDPCWRDLTCLYYHYETQPVPNPLSWFFHWQPKAMHRFAVLFSHFVQVVVPFGLLAPQPVASVAAGLTIFHQFWLIVSGNYSWLNWLTVVLGVAGFSDRILGAVFPIGVPAVVPAPEAFRLVVYLVGALTVVLSVQPVLNLISKDQAMNRSYNPFHLVNTYGAFGSVGKERYEIVIEGTEDEVVTPATQWKEYEFKAKPGDPKRMPPQVAPYHLRLDWLVWFLPFSVRVTARGIMVPGYDLWFVRFMHKLLMGDPGILGLLGRNPFRKQPPRFVRALFYRYDFTNWRERRATGAWWRRELLGTYLQPMSQDMAEKVWGVWRGFDSEE